MLYKKNGAVSYVGSDFIPTWTRFGYGQISIETATHSLQLLDILACNSANKLLFKNGTECLEVANFAVFCILHS